MSLASSVIKTSFFGMLGAVGTTLFSQLQTGQIPQTWRDWLGVGIGALSAAGIYRIPPDGYNKNNPLPPVSSVNSSVESPEIAFLREHFADLKPRLTAVENLVGQVAAFLNLLDPSENPPSDAPSAPVMNGRLNGASLAEHIVPPPPGYVQTTPLRPRPPVRRPTSP
jgi:hypothetical protein